MGLEREMSRWSGKHILCLCVTDIELISICFKLKFYLLKCITPFAQILNCICLFISISSPTLTLAQFELSNQLLVTLNLFVFKQYCFVLTLLINRHNVSWPVTLSWSPSNPSLAVCHPLVNGFLWVEFSQIWTFRRKQD